MNDTCPFLSFATYLPKGPTQSTPVLSSADPKFRLPVPSDSTKGVVPDKEDDGERRIALHLSLPSSTSASTMDHIQSNHQFAEAASSQIPGLSSAHCTLEMRQEPENARVAIGKEKDRKPVDPPPIVQLKMKDGVDPRQNFLQSPYFFLTCSLVNDGTQHIPTGTLGTALAGTLVSSLHRLKDTNNTDGAYFVFGDLSVKIEGRFRLSFNLYQMQGDHCHYVTQCLSNPFNVLSTKNFGGMAESTFLTRTFSDQGVKLRLRKEPRTLLRKRGPADDNYEPRTNNRSANRHQNNARERQPVTSPDSQDSNSQNQNEQADALAAQSFDHRPGTGRNYSVQSDTAYSGANSYEESVKRPRTGSDQSQASSFGHHGQVVESPQYGGRSNSDPQASYNPYPPQFSQYTAYSFTGFSQQAHSREQYAREQYFPKLQTQVGTLSAYDPSIQRSPNSTFFTTPTQDYSPSIQQEHFQNHMLTPLSSAGTQHTQHSQNALEGLGLSRPPQMPSLSQGMQLMAPPTAGRTPQLNNLILGRRPSSASFSDPNQNLSVNSAMFPVRTSSHHPHETSLDGYQ